MSAGGHTGDGGRHGGGMVAVARDFDASALRTCWAFGPDAYERHYVRADVPESAVDVAGLIDNERYGFVTRDIYDTLHPASYRYTVRGFDGIEFFRCFFDDSRVGVLCSFDHDGARDYARLDERLRAFAGDDPERLISE